MPTLAEEIASETETLCHEYPKGMALTDVAGYFGAPLKDVQRAIDTLKRSGAPLPFLKDGPKPREPWEPRETHVINGQIGEREGPHPNKRGRTHPEQLADQIRYQLPELVKLYPLGCTVAQFKEQFGLDTQHAYAAISALEGEGDVVCAYTHDQPRMKIVYARGMREPPPPLTDLQERVLTEITRRAAGANAVTVNYLNVAKTVNGAPGSIPQVCWALERKGYLRRLTPYGDGGEQEEDGRMNGQRSPEYEVLKPELNDPFASQPVKEARHVKPHPHVSKKNRDQTAVKRAIARRAELVREIERIDAFLETFEDLSR